MCFWNIAGMMNKCEETCKYLEGFNVIGLTETLVEKEIWRKIRNKLSDKFIWNCIPARREKKKGRARGGIITAVNKEIMGVKIREINENAMEIKLTRNKNKWRIITLYSQNMKEMESVKNEIKEEEEGYVMLGGDFNARTGEGGPIGKGGRKGDQEMRR